LVFWSPPRSMMIHASLPWSFIPSDGTVSSHHLTPIAGDLAKVETMQYF
jgi:hypothetical protein